MDRETEKELRYYIDIDLMSLKIVKWNSAARAEIIKEAAGETLQRVFLTRGQYNMLTDKIRQYHDF
jgi:hypothetical protein